MLPEDLLYHAVHFLQSQLDERSYFQLLSRLSCVCQRLTVLLRDNRYWQGFFRPIVCEVKRVKVPPSDMWAQLLSLPANPSLKSIVQHLGALDHQISHIGWSIVKVTDGVIQINCRMARQPLMHITCHHNVNHLLASFLCAQMGGRFYRHLSERLKKMWLVCRSASARYYARDPSLLKYIPMDVSLTVSQWLALIGKDPKSIKAISKRKDLITNRQFVITLFSRNRCVTAPVSWGRYYKDDVAVLYCGLLNHWLTLRAIGKKLFGHTQLYATCLASSCHHIEQLSSRVPNAEHIFSFGMFCCWQKKGFHAVCFKAGLRQLQPIALHRKVTAIQDILCVFPQVYPSMSQIIDMDTDLSNKWGEAFDLAYSGLLSINSQSVCLNASTPL